EVSRSPSRASRSSARRWLHRPSLRRPLPAFPTRRSSDLVAASEFHNEDGTYQFEGASKSSAEMVDYYAGLVDSYPLVSIEDPLRSEEHTSELQSRFDLVCRLLLDKNKTSLDPRVRVRQRA